MILQLSKDPAPLYLVVCCLGQLIHKINAATQMICLAEMLLNGGANLLGRQLLTLLVLFAHHSAGREIGGYIVRYSKDANLMHAW